MNASVQQPVRGTVVPTLRYRDVPAAIDWLCTAFGFEKHLVVAGEDGSVRYAQLAFGDGLVMLGAIEDSSAGRLMAQPEDTGGLETQICYLFVDDARAHCVRARIAGAEMVLDIDDEGSDGRGYSCRDPEGHVWNFGTYDPRQCRSVRPQLRATPLQVGMRRLAFAVGMLANAIATTAFIAWLYAATEHTISVAHAGVPAKSAVRDDMSSREAWEKALREAGDQLNREKSARDAAERSARETRDQLAREKKAKEQADRAVAEARDQLERERRAKSAVEPAASELRTALQNAEQAAVASRERINELERAAEKTREEAAGERSRREIAERAAAEAKDLLGKERSAKEAAERAARQAREQAAAAKAPPKKAAPKSSSSGGSSGLLWQ
jgi:uncharacterized glyoxalase superfamily protein PhnB